MLLKVSELESGKEGEEEMHLFIEKYSGSEGGENKNTKTGAGFQKIT